MMANHTGVVALVLLVVASMASMVVPLQIVPTAVPKNNVKLNKPTLLGRGATEQLSRVSFKQIAGIETNGILSKKLPLQTTTTTKTTEPPPTTTNGLKMPKKRPLERPTTTKPPKPPTTGPSAVPSLQTIANIITFIRKSIDQKAEEQKNFYIGITSYKIKAEDVNSETAVRTAQITVLSDRHDDVKVDLHRKLEMVLLYDTVIDPIVPKERVKLNTDTHVRSHATLEALMLHIFCGIPPKSCEDFLKTKKKKKEKSEVKNQKEKTRSEEESCQYFPVGSHFPDEKKKKRTNTTLRDILSRINVNNYKKLDHYTQYNDLCVNKDKGAINGATRSKSNNRGILYFAGFDNDA